MKKNQGFTLIELLVVVLILGIITAIAIPSYLSTVGDARVATGAANAKSIATAVQTDATKTGAADFANYDLTTAGATLTNVKNYLGGNVPDNPCSATTGAGGYTVTGASAASKAWSITPKNDKCTGSTFTAVSLTL